MRIRSPGTVRSGRTPETRRADAGSCASGALPQVRTDRAPIAPVCVEHAPLPHSRMPPSTAGRTESSCITTGMAAPQSGTRGTARTAPSSAHRPHAKDFRHRWTPPNPVPASVARAATPAQRPPPSAPRTPRHPQQAHRGTGSGAPAEAPRRHAGRRAARCHSSRSSPGTGPASARPPPLRPRAARPATATAATARDTRRSEAAYARPCGRGRVIRPGSRWHAAARAADATALHPRSGPPAVRARNAGAAVGRVQWRAGGPIDSRLVRPRVRRLPRRPLQIGPRLALHGCAPAFDQRQGPVDVVPPFRHLQRNRPTRSHVRRQPAPWVGRRTSLLPGHRKQSLPVVDQHIAGLVQRVAHDLARLSVGRVAQECSPCGVGHRDQPIVRQQAQRTVQECCRRAIAPHGLHQQRLEGGGILLGQVQHRADAVDAMTIARMPGQDAVNQGIHAVGNTLDGAQSLSRSRAFGKCSAAHASLDASGVSMTPGAAWPALTLPT